VEFDAMQPMFKDAKVAEDDARCLESIVFLMNFHHNKIKEINDVTKIQMVGPLLLKYTICVPIVNPCLRKCDWIGLSMRDFSHTFTENQYESVIKSYARIIQQNNRLYTLFKSGPLCESVKQMAFVGAPNLRWYDVVPPPERIYY